MKRLTEWWATPIHVKRASASGYSTIEYNSTKGKEFLREVEDKVIGLIAVIIFVIVMITAIVLSSKWNEFKCFTLQVQDRDCAIMRMERNGQ